MILTAADVFPDDPSDPAYKARTDIKRDALDTTPWFLAPYPGMTEVREIPVFVKASSKLFPQFFTTFFSKSLIL